MRRETIHTEDGRTIHLIFVDAAELEEDRLIRREFALAPPVHPCETGEMHAPCHGLQDLFFATEAEIKQGLVLAPHEYAPAIQLCATCPMRAECAAEGIKPAKKRGLASV